MYNFQKLLGIPFLDGGRDLKRGLDCYGLAMVVFNQMGIEIPEYYASAFNDQAVSNQIDKVKNIEWVQLEKEALSVPCLILMKFNSNLENHVGVYIGEGKFIHCRNPIGVNIDRIESPAWRHRIVGFYRLKGEEDE